MYTSSYPHIRDRRVTKKMLCKVYVCGAANSELCLLCGPSYCTIAQNCIIITITYMLPMPLASR